MRRLVIGAALGLVVSLGPPLAAAFLPGLDRFRLLGLYVLGGLVAFGACRLRTRPFRGLAEDDLDGAAGDRGADKRLFPRAILARSPGDRDRASASNAWARRDGAMNAIDDEERTTRK
jgi:hypothetical protein